MRLAQAWQASATKPQPFMPEGDPLPALTPSEIREASAAFPISTAQTFDGFHPRHLALLPDEFLEVVALFLAAVELHGQFPTAILAIISTLLQKAKAKAPGTPAFRGIGLFPAFYRVWAKCRLPIVRTLAQCCCIEKR